MYYCYNCGKGLEDSQEFCPNCGIYIPWNWIWEQEEKQRKEEEKEKLNRSSYQETYRQPVQQTVYVAPVGNPKNKWVAFFLCLFLGGLGAHRFYEGKIGTGILYLFTFGLCGIGILIDLLILLAKPTTYYV